MYYIGIDIGSTAAKTAVFSDTGIYKCFAMPTGWNSKETAEKILETLESEGIVRKESKIVATGYGRISVPFADKTLTEITCHGKGAYFLTGKDSIVIDIGGQDTKIISVKDGSILSFTMNDKCAAGTGRFLELMANTLGLGIEEMCEASQKGGGINISSMCTVFAESEAISLMAEGKSREDISAGVVDSICSKVKALCQKHNSSGNYVLTGGLSQNRVIIEKLAEKLKQPVTGCKDGKYAGAIGAALIAKSI